MTTAPTRARGADDDDTLATRDRLLVAVAVRLLDAGENVSVHGDGTLVATIDGARLVVSLAPRATSRGPLRTAHWTLAYRMEGATEGLMDRCRALLLAMAEVVTSLEADPARTLDVRAIVPWVDHLRRAIVERRDVGTREAPRGLPACIELSTRPPWPIDRAFAHRAPLHPTCAGCGRVDACADARVAGEDDAEPSASGSRPAWRSLRHRDERRAVEAALACIVQAFDASMPPAVPGFVEAAFERRGDEAGAIHQPLELSIKRGVETLSRTIRLVDYGPREPGASSRREHVVRTIAACASSPVVDAVTRILDLVEASLGPSPELSFGLDAPLDGSEPRHQIYVHLPANDASAVRALLARTGARVSDPPSPTGDAVLAYAGAATPPDAPGLVPTLLAHAPTNDAPMRTKLYLACELGTSRPELGIRPASFGALAPFAPTFGLVVLESDGESRTFRKHDVPCATHFQHVDRVVDAFAEGLLPAERTRLLRILGGDAFAPWPTWLSVAGAARTFYFVPR